ncbi:MAG TPA: hypothetical protein P5511_04790, partial [Candidatus Goldiibacteriota bacterium]|nr:hypothetical protein [Candidatus Goldiibacteriota bacterium]
MGRRQVMQMAADFGAKLCDYVRARTDILVVGEPKGETESSKLRKAKKMAQEGSKIVIVDENDFMKNARFIKEATRDK